MNSDPDDPCTCPDDCRYWCSIHEAHHVVPSLIQDCLERATAPSLRDVS